MSRITWQNVTGPDFSDAIAARKSAGEMIANAFNTVGGSLSEMDARLRAEASKEAMSKAMQIGSSEDWDAMMAKGGLAQLGIGADMASQDLLDFMKGRRAALLNDERSVQIMGHADNIDARAEAANVRANAQEADRATLFDFDFAEKQYQQGRRRTEDAETDENKRIREEAQEWAQKHDQNYLDLARAQRAVLNDDTLSPKEQAARLEEISKRNGFWQADPNNSLDPETNAVLQDATDDVNLRRSQLNIKLANSPAAQLIASANEDAKTYGSPDAALLDRVLSRVAKDDEETISIVQNSAGQLQGLLDQFSDEYDQIPAGIIAKVVENNFKQSDWLLFFGGDEVEVSKEKVRRELDKLKTADLQAGAQRTLSALMRQMAALDTEQANIDRLSQDLNVAQAIGYTGDQAALQARLDALRGSAAERAAQNEAVAAFGRGGRGDAFDTLATQGAAGLTPGSGESFDSAVARTGGGTGSNPRVDPRVEEFRRGVGGAVGAVAGPVATGMQASGRMLLGQLGAPFADATEAAAYATSLVAPETGSRMLEGADELRATTDDLAVGLAPGQERAPTVEEAPIEEPSLAPFEAPPISPQVVKAASEQPAETLAAVLDEMGVRPQMSQAVLDAVRMLQSSQPIPVKTEQELQRRVRETVQRILRENNGSASPDAIALLANAEQWLGLDE